jgi:peptide chain release factor 1
VRPKAARTPSCWSTISSPSTRSSEPGGVFSVEIVDERAGQVELRVRGPNARAIFEGESGGHRWQRVPPTEKRGRVHSSTITVAVLDEVTERELVIPDRDLDWNTCRGSGKGGQHLQKTETAVQVVHLPTGLAVRCESERSQHENRVIAMKILRARVLDRLEAEAGAERAHRRKTQIGSGMRGDKRRTIRVQDDNVLDHLTGRTWRYKDYVRGNW